MKLTVLGAATERVFMPLTSTVTVNLRALSITMPPVTSEAATVKVFVPSVSLVKSIEAISKDFMSESFASGTANSALEGLMVTSNGTLST